MRATESGQLFRVKQDNLTAIDAPYHISASKENQAPNNATTTPRLKKDPSEGGGTSSGTALPHPGISDSASAGSLGGGTDGEEGALEPGCIIQLHGLKSAMVFNGQTAEIISVDQARGRYEIRLNDGSIKTVRTENVKYVSAGSKASPRQKSKAGGGKATK